jgi:hypothetical protein
VEHTGWAAIIVLLSAHDYLLLDNIAVSPAQQMLYLLVGNAPSPDLASADHADIITKHRSGAVRFRYSGQQ